MTKRTMDIEAVLRWAYRDELPKVVGKRRALGPRSNAWHPVSRYGLYLALIDDSASDNLYGVLPDLSMNGEPHADAVKVADAVVALEAFRPEVPEGWNPIDDLGDLSGDAAGIIAAAAHWSTVSAMVPRLLIKHAILGGCPEWQGEMPMRKPVRGPNGKAVWRRRALVMIHEGDAGLGIEPEYIETVIDGYNSRRGRPYADAYRETYLDPDPRPLAISRAEYELWYAGLAWLVDELSGVLDTIALVPLSLPARPWECDAPLERRVLPSLIPQKIVQIPQGFRKRSQQKMRQAA